MRLHDEWETVGFAMEPRAELVGPFVGHTFLEVLWRHRGGEVLFAEAEDAFLALCFAADGVLEFLGEADLTDYHAPRGPGVPSLVGALASAVDPGTRIVWDSLPAEAVQPLVEGLAAAGIEARVDTHEVAAVLDLPPTHAEYLESIGSKQRHEVRRKARRFADAFGPPSLTRRTDRQALATFADLHRAAAGDKGAFMTEAMERLFADLLDRVPGACIDLLGDASGRTLAAVFGFDDGRAYYLYNSAFDPDAGHASPGVVLVDRLIDAAIASGLRRFDFLKGDETYKFRLGAVERPLFRVEAVT